MRMPKLALLALAATVAIQFGGSTGALASPSDYDVTGIDVSHYQGTIDWSSVAGAGIDFAYAKATEGLNFIDAYYNANRSGARNAGIYFGAYAFGRPDQGSPRTQADKFIDTSLYSSDGRTLPPMLDIEWPKEGPACYGLSANAMVSWISQFVDQVRVRTEQKAMRLSRYAITALNMYAVGRYRATRWGLNGASRQRLMQLMVRWRSSGSAPVARLTRMSSIISTSVVWNFLTRQNRCGAGSSESVVGSNT